MAGTCDSHTLSPTANAMLRQKTTAYETVEHPSPAAVRHSGRAWEDSRASMAARNPRAARPATAMTGRRPMRATAMPKPRLRTVLLR